MRTIQLNAHESIKEMIQPYISSETILRYLHFKGDSANEEQLAFIQTGVRECLKRANFKHQIVKCDISIKEDELTLLSSEGVAVDSIVSSDLARTITPSDSLYMVAVTIGKDISQWIQAQMHLSPSVGVVADACASVIVDAYCDWCQDQIATVSRENGRYTSQRYSPGYGDLKLSAQKILGEYLGLEKSMGVFITNAYQLVPEKSVIFVMGESEVPINSVVRTCGNDCSQCLLKTCHYRRIHHE